MTIEAQTIRIPDLSDEERQDLTGEMPAGTVRFEEEPVRDPAHGRDLSAIAAIVVVSEVALRVLAIWIMRHTTREETEVSIQTQNPDGSTKTIHIRSKSASTQSEEGILRQLAAACKVDLEPDPVEAIKGLLGGPDAKEKPETSD